jgi:large subunit ribosomal protein L46
MGAQEGEPDHIMDALIQDVEVPVVNKFQGEEANKKELEDAIQKRPMPRVTEADKAGDERSLNRALARTLYLLVQGKDGKWAFPGDALLKKESLHLVSSLMVCTFEPVRLMNINRRQNESLSRLVGSI